MRPSAHFSGSDRARDEQREDASEPVKPGTRDELASVEDKKSARISIVPVAHRQGFRVLYELENA